MIKLISLLSILSLSACVSTQTLERLKAAGEQAQEKVQAISENTTTSLTHLKAANKDCQNSLLSSSIINGRSVITSDPLSKQAVLLLTQKGSKTSSCTAVPIAQHILVTAAHCVAGAKPDAITAVFETSDLCTSGSTRKVSISAVSVVVHEEFNGSPQSKADLALIKINSPIPTDYKVGTLFDGESKLSNDDVVMLGYGITDEKKQDSMVLRTTTKSFSTDAYVKGPIIGFKQNNKTGGFCRGDSGAPIYVNSGGSFKIIGINSFNLGKEKDQECKTASVGMYTPHFRKWIITKVLSL